VKEIVLTERSYVKSLSELHENWEKPLREACKAGKPILSHDEIDSIFTISEGIHCLHQNMLKSLEERLENWSESQNIGDIFIRNANALKLYTEYINGYNNSMVLLNEAQKKTSFIEFAKHRCGKSNPAHILTSLLIQPIQRIPRYEMLLKDLVQSTWLSHDDLPALETALEKIIDAAVFINEQKRKAESLGRLLEIQNELKDKVILYTSGREIISEGRVAFPKEKKGKKSEKVNYCLASDKLLIWKESRDYLIGDLNEIVFIQDDHTQLTLKCNSTNQTVSLAWKEKTLKDEWTTQFITAKKKERKR